MRTIKYLGIFSVIFGVFLVVGLASASTADLLQPAAEIIYNEDLIVNGTGRFNSVRIGQQDVGGVTFFNGTIINETTSNGVDNPVVFGDSVRIDGEIWRGVSKGTADNMPLKISDTMIPTLGGINDFGSASNRWKDIYYSGTLQGGDAEFSGDVTWEEPKKGYVSIPGYFCEDGANLVKATNFTYCGLAPGATYAAWEVNIPNDVEVTSFGGWIYDNDTGNMKCYLVRVKRTSPPSTNNMGSFGTSGTSTSWKEIKDDTINNSTISNKDYSYLVKCTGNPGANQLRISSFRITYEKSKLD
jgi:hypothetical protein